MSRPLEILVLGDGKPGHLNQSFGLAEALARRTPVRHRKLTLDHRLGLRECWRLYRHAPEPRPDLVLAAGHRTHLALLAITRGADIPGVLLMKPSLPARLFDLCLVPRHDLGGREPGPDTIATLGALNRVPPPGDDPRQGGLILIGGPSKSHDWDGEAIRRMVSAIVAERGQLAWRATDSRRTPGGVLAALTEACPALLSFPHGETGRDWLPQHLARAEEVWVTADSVSMIYEALSSGARVGVLPVPARQAGGRVARGIDELVRQGYLTRFEDRTPGEALPPPPSVPREADRCARIVLERFFPQRLPA